MTDFQFLQLLKNEIADFYFANADGKCKSTLSALELIRMFREDIERKTFENFKKGLHYQILTYHENIYQNRSRNPVPSPPSGSGCSADVTWPLEREEHEGGTL